MVARSLFLLVSLLTLWAPASPAAIGPAPGSAEPKEPPWLSGPDPDPHFDRLGSNEGLSQISINDLVQDQQGWLWVATQDGINRFDGYQFRVFRHDPDDPGSPATSLVMDLFLDSRNRLWAFSNQTGVLQYFDPRAQRFFNFHHRPGDAASPLPARVNRRAVHEDRGGRLWLGTDIGLQILDPDSGRLWRVELPHIADTAVQTLLEDQDGRLWIGTRKGLLRLRRAAEEVPFGAAPEADLVLPDHVIGHLLRSRSGNLWIGTHSGLYRFDPRSGRLRHHPVPPSLAMEDSWNRLAAGNLERPMLEDRHGRLWLITFGGLLRYDPLEDRFRAWPPDPPNSAAAAEMRSPSNSVLLDLFEDHQGQLWFASAVGLYLHRPESDDFLRYSHHPAEPRSLSNNLLTVLFEDHSGNLWIGTEGGGLSRLSPYKNQFRLLQHRPSQPDSLGENKVFSVLVDSRDTLWVGTSEAGLHRFDAGRQRVVERYGDQPGSARDLGSQFVRSLLEARDGLLWVGTVGGGVSVLDPTTSSIVKSYTADTGDLGTNVIYGLSEFSDGSIWVGSNAGIHRIDPASGAIARWRHDPDDSSSLPANVVRFAFEDSQRRIWLGTVSGLARYHPPTAGDSPEPKRHADRDGASTAWAGATGPAGWHSDTWPGGSFSRYQHRVGDPTSLSQNVLMAMHEDREGRLWVVTHGGGLDLFDPERGTFRAFRKRDGLPTDTLYAILEDDDGYLWLSSNGGLSRFDPTARTFTNYGAQDGLGGEEFNGRAACRGTAGELLFGGIHGLNFFHPRRLRSNPHPPPVRLTNFYILDQRQHFDRALDQLAEVEIGYRQNFFAFEFTALDYTSPRHNRYAYQLEGFDRDWIDAGTRRYASYTNLDGGEYTFRVRGSNSDGVWSSQAATLRVRVIPPPWKTWWAYSGYLLLACAGVAGFVRYRVRTQEAELRERQRELERRALAAEHQRQAEELERARDLQLSMLPPAPPPTPGLDIATFMRTATEVGGDYYDFFPQRDGSLFVVTGDATGHGLSAGMMVSMTKATLKALAAHSPSTLLGELNRVLRTMELKRLRMALNVLHLAGQERDGQEPDGHQHESRRVTLSSAGMPPVLLRRGANVEEVLLPGLPLGSQVDEHYRETSFDLHPGDVLVLYSDGLPEWIEEQTGEPGYQAVQRSLEAIGDGGARRILDALLQAGGLAQGAPPPRDDITVLVIRSVG